MKRTLEISSGVYTDLLAHLVRPNGRVEEAAFGFAERQGPHEEARFRLADWMPVPPKDFAIQAAYHIELTDEARAAAIKRAHDLGACLVEFHCHLGRWPASFSPSDRSGLRQFVPHVMWRLKGRPYVAVVVARSGHDGLVWIEDWRSPERLEGLRVDGRLLSSTGLTPLPMDDDDE